MGDALSLADLLVAYHFLVLYLTVGPLFAQCKQVIFKAAELSGVCTLLTAAAHVTVEPSLRNGATTTGFSAPFGAQPVAICGLQTSDMSLVSCFLLQACEACALQLKEM